MVVVTISDAGKFYEGDKLSDVEKIKIKHGKNCVNFYLENSPHSPLKKRIDEKVIPALKKEDKDYIICIDGRERTGKSTLATQIARYVDPTFNLSRMVFTPEEFKNAIFNAKRGQAIIYDESFSGLSSRGALSPINKYLVGLMMQMGQKNLFVILVLPTFYLLDGYAAMFRTRLLIHVYENKKGQRGFFRLYSYKKKKLLYLFGKKTYSYAPRIRGVPIYTRFRGKFFKNFALGDEKEYKKYQKKKEEALKVTEHTSMSAGQIKYREQRDLVIYLLRKELKLTYEQLSNLIGEYDLEISLMQVRNICSKFGDKPHPGERLIEELKK